MEKCKECLLKQGVWEREVDELLGQFNVPVTEADLKIVTIFDSAHDLASNYVDNVIGELDHHVKAVLDFAELGKHLTEFCEEYVLLNTGRIVAFEL